MRVGIDARTLLIPHKRGIGRHLDHLINSMVELDASLELILFAENDHLTHPSLTTRLLTSKGYRFRLWERLYFPIDAWRQHCDIVHCPANTCPPFTFCPVVLTIHDLNLLKDPSRMDSDIGVYFARQLASAVKHARKIITVSKSSKEDLLEKFPNVRDDKIEVIYNGLDDKKYHSIGQDDIQRILPDFDAAGKYIMLIGAQDVFKGTDLAFEAYSRIAKEVEHDLIITSLPPSMREQYRNIIADHKLTGRVHLLDFISDEEINALYNLAQIFLFPSRFEGFGLPLLEAMRCHCRIVATDIPTSREIAQGYAILVPDDVEQFADAVKTAVKTYESFDFKKQEQHCMSFSWQDAARKTIEVYKQAAQ